MYSIVVDSLLFLSLSSKTEQKMKRSSAMRIQTDAMRARRRATMRRWLWFLYGEWRHRR
jgi:hypothetical protein